MKKYKARVELTLEAENIDDALNEVHNCLMLGVSPESVDIQQVAEIPEHKNVLDLGEVNTKPDWHDEDEQRCQNMR